MQESGTRMMNKWFNQNSSL